MDIGTGDGAFVYRSARAAPQRLFIGLDSNADNLAEYSRKALRKPARGGVPNALYVHAKAEALPEELDGLASQVTILLPWGSLLKAVAEADAGILAGIERICQPGAEVRIVFGYDAVSEPGVINQLALPLLNEDCLERLVDRYAANGFEMRMNRLGKTQVAELPTTWARKLAYGRDRGFFELRGWVTRS